jgi:nitrogen regulatory protein P-II 2
MIMQLYRKRLLTIVTEQVLEDELIALVEGGGAHGYTIVDARGGGAHGHQQASWSADCNIRMDVVAEAAVAETLAGQIHQRFGAHYALVQFLSDVDVIRGNKF